MIPPTKMREKYDEREKLTSNNPHILQNKFNYRLLHYGITGIHDFFSSTFKISNVLILLI